MAGRLEGKQVIVALNKCDLADTPTFLSLQGTVIEISAKKGQNIIALQEKLVEFAALPDIQTGDVIVTNARHYEALIHALAAIRRVQEGLSTNLSGDFISQDLRECIFHLSDIVGDVTTDEVLSSIFEHFCIGK